MKKIWSKTTHFKQLQKLGSGCDTDGIDVTSNTVYLIQQTTITAKIIYVLLTVQKRRK